MNSVKAKKRFGQNFLHDEAIVKQIVESMPNTSHAIAEIGPGLGDLTKYLVTIRSVDAFEIDTELCRHIAKRFEKEIAQKQLQLHCGDVLEVWSNALLHIAYDLVANLPYYVATSIILRALHDDNCKNMVVMVQKEVAQKFAAQCGEKSFSALSVLAQSVAQVRLIIDVPPSAFHPAPKVDSAVLKIEKFASLEDEAFSEFLRFAFKQPRKTLIKNLAAIAEASWLKSWFAGHNFQSSIRPHQLNTSDYHQLYNELKKEFGWKTEKMKQ